MISKHKSGRYYYCEVSNIEQELFCKALFDDGSLSTNLYPEDFQVIFVVTFTLTVSGYFSKITGCAHRLVSHFMTYVIIVSNVLFIE